MLNVEVSVYRNCRDNVGTTTSLLDFLQSEKYKEEVIRMRSLEDKFERSEIKRNLPCVCVSGIFAPTRKADSLVKHSGLICIDIDLADNLHIDNFEKLNQEICKLEEVAYMAHSAGGKGWFVIIPIQYPQYHREQFTALERDFLRLGIVIDSNCKDVCRLRAYSFDSSFYINENAKPYKSAIFQKKPEIRQYNDSGKVWELINDVIRSGSNLCPDYDSYLRVAAALANELGESGRSAFHQIASVDQKYNYRDADRKYSEGLKMGNISIGTFFKICKDNNIF